jgi:hypothetical protein
LREEKFSVFGVERGGLNGIERSDLFVGKCQFRVYRIVAREGDIRVYLILEGGATVKTAVQGSSSGRYEHRGTARSADGVDGPTHRAGLFRGVERNRAAGTAREHRKYGASDVGFGLSVREINGRGQIEILLHR